MNTLTPRPTTFSGATTMNQNWTKPSSQFSRIQIIQPSHFLQAPEGERVGDPDPIYVLATVSLIFAHTNHTHNAATKACKISDGKQETQVQHVITTIFPKPSRIQIIQHKLYSHKLLSRRQAAHTNHVSHTNTHKTPAKSRRKTHTYVEDPGRMGHILVRGEVGQDVIQIPLGK